MKLVDWERFQGYRKRGPLWIKLHTSLVDQPQFLGLPLVARAVLPVLWITAARVSDDGSLPDDLKVLAIVSHTSEDELAAAIPHLCRAGFLLCDKPVAIPAPEVSPQKEREERERRVEGEVLPPVLLSLAGEPVAPPSATPPTPPAVKVTNRETWLTGYGEDWRARWGVASEPPYGQLAKAIRKAHEEHGEPKLRAAWRAYLASEAEAKWAKPATFVQGLGQWLGQAPVLVPSRASPRVSVVEQNRAVLDQWERDVAEGRR
jgi:hypothetical protein